MVDYDNDKKITVMAILMTVIGLMTIIAILMIMIMVMVTIQMMMRMRWFCKV